MGRLPPSVAELLVSHVEPPSVDLDRLHHAVRHRAAQVDVQKPMLHRRARNLHPVGQDEAALELPRRDPAMQEHALPVILGLLAAHDKLLVLHGDRRGHPRPKTGHGQRDAVRVLAPLFDIVGRVAFVPGLRGPFHEALQLIESQEERVRSKRQFRHRAHP
jgi:hypothetical protein